QFATGTRLVSWLSAVIYKLIGPSALFIKVVMSFLGALTVWNIHRITNELAGDQIAMVAAWIAVFYPTLALHSSIFLREAPIAYLFSWAALQGVLGIRRQRGFHFVI